MAVGARETADRDGGRLSRLGAVWLALAALMVPACNALFGVDDLGPDDASANNSGGSGGSGGDGSGGAGGTTGQGAGPCFEQSDGCVCLVAGDDCPAAPDLSDWDTTIQLYVGPQGEVNPCDFDPLSMGNVRDAPLHVLWDRFAARGYDCSSLDGCRRQKKKLQLVDAAADPDASEQRP